MGEMLFHGRFCGGETFGRFVYGRGIVPFSSISGYDMLVSNDSRV